MSSVDVQVRRTLAGPPVVVWQALTTPAGLAAWFWPETFRTTAVLDLRVGGQYRIASPVAGIAATGRYVAVEPPRQLAFSWRWEGEAEETLVTVRLAAVGDGTELVLVHERFADDTSRANHDKGWSDCLDRLPGWLSATVAGPEPGR